MSSDSIPGYELLTRVSDGSVRTYHALSRTGAVVMVHFVEEAGDGSARARTMIERLPSQERRKVLEVVEARGGMAVVTKFILDFDSFFAWLTDRVPELPAPSASDLTSGFTEAFRSVDEPLPASDPSTSPPAAEPGEFTRAFQAIRGEGHTAAPTEPPAVPTEPPTGVAGPPSVAPAVPGSTPAEPGEFTRAFRAITGHPLVPRPPDPAPAAPAVEPSAVGPPPAPEQPSPVSEGEFTRMFHRAGPSGDAVSVDPPGVSNSPRPGAPGVAPIFPAADPPRPPPSPAGPTFGFGSALGEVEPPAPAAGGSDPGEFTRLFGAVPRPPVTPTEDAALLVTPPPTPSHPAADGEPATPGGRAGELPAPNFGGTGSESPPPPTVRTPAVRWDEPLPPMRAEPPRSAAAPPDSRPESGPGDFTRMFGRVDVPSSPGTPSAPAPSAGGLDYRPPAVSDAPTSIPRSGASGDDYLSRLAGRGSTFEPTPPANPPVSPAAPTGADGPAIPHWLGGGGLDGRTPVPPAGPSEYTRVISAMTSPPVVPAPTPPTVPVVPTMAPVAPGQARPAGRPVALLVGIVLVVVLILAVILFFVLRPSPTPPAAGGEAPGVEAPEQTPTNVGL